MNTNKQIKRVEYLKNTAAVEYVNNKNLTVTELSKKYKCSIGTLSKILKSLNIIVRDKYHYIVLNNFFEKIESSESAYWLGFIFADGSVTYDPNIKSKQPYKLEIGLCAKDKEHLYKFKKFIGTDKKIEYREKSNSYRITISSKKLAINLCNLGIVKNKTYKNSIKKVLNNVPDIYFKDFLKGYTDGDGSIFKKGIVSYTAYDVNTIVKILEKVPFKLEYKTYITSNRSPRICVTKSKYWKKLLNYIYKNSTLHLDRKYERYIAVLNSDV